MISLVSGAPSLHKLTLYSHDVPNVSSFFERLSSAKALPRLQEFNLSNEAVSQEALSGLILRFRDSLSTLSIHNIYLINGGNWASILREYGSKLPSLRQFSLGPFWEWWGHGHAPMVITYGSLRDNPLVPGVGTFEFIELGIIMPCAKREYVKYQGEHAGKALEVIAASMVDDC